MKVNRTASAQGVKEPEVDTEIEAIRVILATLDKLQSSQRMRVVAYIRDRFIPFEPQF